MTASAAVSPGTTWKRRHHLAAGETVLVLKVSSTGSIQARRKDGKTWTIPLAAFLHQYEVCLDDGPHKCARCGSSSLRLIDKYCKDCQAFIGRMRNARHAQEEPVLTTTNPRVIEQKQQDAQRPVAPKPEDQAPPPKRVLKWHITARVQLDMYVDGATVIDALGAAEGQYPGMEVTDVHLLD